MSKRIGRRQFLKSSAGMTLAGATLSQADAADRAKPGAAGSDYAVSWYEFTEHQDSDACWSLSVGPDGRIYASACAESTPGGVVKVVRYDEQKDALQYLFSADEVVDDPADSGRATQCKIHYSLAPSTSDGILYMASHVSAPPIDRPAYSPWGSWHDKERCFRGSALLAFDTRTDEVRWWDTLIPKEGCRCLLHDEERGLLYAISYPRDHFIVYDIRKRTHRDVGRIGSINAQALFLDKRHRVWTTDDYGHLVGYDPDKDRLEASPFVLPHNPAYQTGWHSVFYDVVAAPDGESVFAVTWIADCYLMRIWPNEGEWPRVENLGPTQQRRDLTVATNTFLDHCGGLTIGGDGQLYYVASRWRDPVHNPDAKGREGVIWRLDPATNEREEVAILECEGKTGAQYVSRGAVDHNGDLFFGHVGSKPSGLFKVQMPADRKKRNAHMPIRMWG